MYLQNFLFGQNGNGSRKQKDYILDREMMVWFEQVITERQTELEDIGRASSLEDLDYEVVRTQYGELIERKSREMLAPVKLDEARKQSLEKLLITLLLAPEFSDFSTGLVVAGYGRDSLFPEISAAELGGIIVGKLKHSDRTNKTVSGSDEAGQVVSFAQTDVIERLLGGADPQFISKTAEFIEIAVRDAANSIEELCRPKRISRSEIDRRRFAIDAVVEVLVSEYNNSTSEKLKNRFTKEFDRMIAMMPKQELVELAEALISITAVERKASSDEGTVGGPIDVALITKHDGFIWIKRKHHFKSYLNPGFFWRKYGSGFGGGNHDSQEDAS